mgnify:CR=1 FL=1
MPILILSGSGGHVGLVLLNSHSPAAFANDCDKVLT